MTFKIAFTGTGYIAKIHARAVQAHPDAELVAVVNHQPQSMAAFTETFNISRQYRDIQHLLAEGGVDALVINTPNALHAPEAMAALKAGIHVMVEKPMAKNAAEALEMIVTSQQSKALLMVAHCWRFDEEVNWLKNQVDQGRIGPVIRSKGYGVHVNWGPGGWFVQPELAGGGALADMGIHAIDTVRYLMGDPQPVSVFARIGTYYKDIKVDDTGLIIVNWDNGATSYIESGWWQPYADGPEASTQLYGLKGMGQLFPTSLILTCAESKMTERISSGFPPSREPHCPQQMYNAQFAHFIDCIKNNTTPTPGGAEGLVNMQVVDAAYESSQTGRLISVQSLL